jgi:ABC-2 type transport system permease protein
MPITHAAEAARRLAAGEQFAAVFPLIATELAIAAGYALLSMVLLRYFETESRKHASLDLT